LADDPHVVLRISAGASAPIWWSAASQRRDAPPSIGALLAGRRRVELTSEEAAEAVAWACGLDGWAASEPKPIFIYEPGTD
jgi:hypothetical protein